MGCLKAYHFSRQVRSTTLLGIVIASQGSGPVQVETEGSDLPWLCYSSSYLAQCRESDLRCMAWPCRENRVYALRRKPCDT